MRLKIYWCRFGVILVLHDGYHLLLRVGTDRRVAPGKAR